jgi:hypothetical protein
MDQSTCCLAVDAVMPDIEEEIIIFTLTPQIKRTLFHLWHGERLIIARDVSQNGNKVAFECVVRLRVRPSSCI